MIIITFFCHKISMKIGIWGGGVCLLGFFDEVLKKFKKFQIEEDFRPEIQLFNSGLLFICSTVIFLELF